MSIRSHLVSQPKNILLPNPRDKNLTNSHINPGTTDKNKYSKVRATKILLDSVVNTSIICKDELNECHSILKQKKTKKLTMAGIFNTNSSMELILNLPKINHAKNINAKCL